MALLAPIDIGVANGLVFAWAVLAFTIAYRLFDFPDLTVDASVMLGAAVYAAYLTHADLPVVNAEPVDGVDGIAETLRRRREEFTTALERGAVIVVFAHAPMGISGVAGFQGLDRYFFLPAPAGMAWDATTLRGGAGSTFAAASRYGRSP